MHVHDTYVRGAADKLALWSLRPLPGCDVRTVVACGRVADLHCRHRAFTPMAAPPQILVRKRYYNATDHASVCQGPYAGDVQDECQTRRRDNPSGWRCHEDVLPRMRFLFGYIRRHLVYRSQTCYKMRSGSREFGSLTGVPRRYRDLLDRS